MLLSWDQLHNELKGLTSGSLLPRLQEDQVQRWKAQQPALVEEYLQRFPELKHNTESVLILILGEVLQREALAQAIDEKEYLDRFPTYREPLQMQLAFHQAMGQVSSFSQTGNSEQKLSDTQPPDLTGEVIADKYKLRERIGEGGMGTVWRAEQLHPVKRQVAIKLIKPGMDSKAVLTRFEAERQALAVMDHPNIAKVLDAGITRNSMPFFIMELVKGTPITVYCDTAKLTPRERLELFVPVCHAIQHAHQKGIIHRDIKPSNVLIALYDERAVPKVIDFGVAKATQKQLTEATLETGIGNVIGTPEYMSPEQASLNNLDVDTRSDVYSLGALLYELLAGSPPFKATEYRQAGLLEMLRMVREEDPPRPSDRLSSSNLLAVISVNRAADSKKLVSSLKNELDLIVMKALDKDRTRRYDSAGSLAADLQRYLVGEPVQAHPPSAVYRLKKLVYKNRAYVISAGLVFLALLAGLAGTTFGFIKAARQRNEADFAWSMEADQRMKAELEKRKAEEAEAQTLSAYRAGTDLAIEQLIGSKEELGIKERSYLEKSLELWKQFAERKGDDEHSMNLRAEGHFRVGTIWGKMGNNLEAIKEFTQSFELRKKLAKDHPEQRDYQRNLALTHYSFCYQLRDQSKWSAALEQGKSALMIQKQLVEKCPNDLIYPLELSRTHNIIGLILTTQGRDQEAETAYQAALRIQLKLAEQSPDSVSHNWTLSSTYSKLGNIWMRRKRPEEAIKQFHSSQQMLEKVANQFPEDSEANAELADVYTRLARAYLSLGQYAKSQENNLASITIQQKLVTLYPLKHKYHLSLANTHTNYALLLQRLGKPDEAIIQLQSARAIQKMLTIRYPQNIYYQIKLASNDASLGGIEYDRGKYPESIKLYDQAIEVLSPLLSKSPDDPVTREYLSQIYAARANASGRLKQFKEAFEAWGQAIKIGLPRQVPAFRARRAHWFVQAGRIEEAIAEATVLSSTPGIDGSTKWTDQQWFDLACVYAAAYGKSGLKNEAYAERSIFMLQKSLEAGYRKLNDFKNETALDSLRDRKDFKQIMESAQSRMGSTE